MMLCSAHGLSDKTLSYPACHTSVRVSLFTFVAHDSFAALQLNFMHEVGIVLILQRLGPY